MGEVEAANEKELRQAETVGEMVKKRSVVVRPVWTFSLILLTVAIGEFLVMGLVHLLPELAFGFEVLLDILLLLALLAIVLYRHFLIPIQSGEKRSHALRMALDDAMKEISVFDAEIAHKVLHDPLTDLPNRLLFHDRLEHEISVVDRSEENLVLLFLDPEPISVINETLGHDAGDDVLVQVAARLKGVLRESDTLARMAGDEFAILMPTDDQKLANDMATRIHQVFEEPFKAGDIDVDVVLRAGIAIYPLHARGLIDLMRRADIALRQAKREIRNTVIYSEEHESKAMMRREIFRELRDALVRGDFRLLYQPKMNIESGKVTGVEALIRLNGSNTSPSSFIPVAEQSGLIDRLSLWVLEEALRQISEWKQQGLRVRVSVNLSVRNLLDTGLTGKIESLLQRYSVDASSITIEVIESAVMEHADRSIAVLRKLSDMGLMISIDDFGTGYSSMAHLKAMPASELKIDQGFIRNMTESEADDVIVKSTIQLAHNFGLSVVAEGVETEEVMERLKSYGCDVVQGFLVSHPLSPEEFANWCEGVTDDQDMEGNRVEQ